MQKLEQTNVRRTQDHEIRRMKYDLAQQQHSATAEKEKLMLLHSWERETKQQAAAAEKEILMLMHNRDREKEEHEERMAKFNITMLRLEKGIDGAGDVDDSGSVAGPSQHNY